MMLMELQFQRRVDGATHHFTRAGTAYGYPAYRRTDDPSLWCRRLPDFGWSVCTDPGHVLARSFAEPGRGQLPPEGMWVSGKGDRAYVYDLTMPTER
jgi:hypothetical protein